MKEEDLRALLDEHGILRATGSAAAGMGDRSSGFSVFAQRPNVILDLPALKHQAERFFAAKVGLTVDKSYGQRPPDRDIAHVIIRTDDGTASGTRLIYGRAADASDYAAAEAAERVQGTSGMALLAQRCPTLWIVTIESSEDRTALTIAAILASHFLGPILSADGSELFGVRTARTKLERLGAHPFR